jgi:PKD repeat protein
VVAAQKSDLVCYNANNGSIAAQSVVAGEMNYTWYNENNQVIASEISASGSEINNLSAGSYFLVISGDNLTCGESVIAFEIEQPLAETVEISSVVAPCNAENNAEVLALLSNTDDYSWSITGNGYAVSGSSESENLHVQNLQAGIYTLSINTACNSWNTELNLSDPMAVNADFSSSAQVVELHNGAASVNFNFNGSGAELYEWNFGDGSAADLQNPSHTYAAEGDYTVTLHASNANCSNQSQMLITVLAESVGLEEIISAEVAVIYGNDQISLQFDAWNEGLYTINLYDMSGKLVLSEISNINQGTVWNLPLDKMTAGAYQISIVDQNQMIYNTRIVR